MPRADERRRVRRGHVQREGVRNRVQRAVHPVWHGVRRRAVGQQQLRGVRQRLRRRNDLRHGRVRVQHDVLSERVLHGQRLRRAAALVSRRGWRWVRQSRGGDRGVREAGRICRQWHGLLRFGRECAPGADGVFRDGRCVRELRLQL